MPEAFVRFRTRPGHSQRIPELLWELLGWAPTTDVL
jgi:hypothetical protein